MRLEFKFLEEINLRVFQDPADFCVELCNTLCVVKWNILRNIGLQVEFIDFVMHTE